MLCVVFGNVGDYYINFLFGDLYWMVGEVVVFCFQNGIFFFEGFYQMYYELVVEIWEEIYWDWIVWVFLNFIVSYIQADWVVDVFVQARLMAVIGQEFFWDFYF